MCRQFLQSYVLWGEGLYGEEAVIPSGDKDSAWDCPAQAFVSISFSESFLDGK